ALGDDLDAPVDTSAPMHWSLNASDADPSLPGDVDALAAHIEAPAELRRRLKQIGVVPKERGAELAAQLKAARRLAERARLIDIEIELEQARTDATTRRQELEAAEAALRTAAEAESSAR